jgi:hypothetical protein
MEAPSLRSAEELALDACEILAGTELPELSDEVIVAVDRLTSEAFASSKKRIGKPKKAKLPVGVAAAQWMT